MMHDVDMALILNRAAHNQRLVAARENKESATSTHFADMEAEEAAWQRLRRAFYISIVLLVGLMASVVFA